MPVMDGFSLLEKIKKDPALYLKPVILLTARAGKEDKLKALRIGVDDYLSKPFESDELLIRLNNLILKKAETANKNGKTKPSEKDEFLELSPFDLEWLQRAEDFVSKHLDDSRLSADFLSEHMHVSSRHLSRKLKALTQLNTSQYIQEVKLQTAREWLESGSCSTVKEASYKVGFSKTDYFSQLFSKRFGKTPSSLLR